MCAITLASCALQLSWCGKAQTTSTGCCWVELMRLANIHPSCRPKRHPTCRTACCHVRTHCYVKRRYIVTCSRRQSSNWWRTPWAICWVSARSAWRHSDDDDQPLPRLRRQQTNWSRTWQISTETRNQRILTLIRIWRTIQVKLWLPIYLARLWQNEPQARWDSIVDWCFHMIFLLWAF